LAETLLSILPCFYKNFLDPFLNNLEILELNSNCNSCNKLDGYKCCNYKALIPNYLIGYGLESGNVFLNDIISDPHYKINFLTKGFFPCNINHLLLRIPIKNWSQNKLGCDFFHYEDGICRIWDFRNSICRTYFCNNNSQCNEELFWDIIREYLINIEDILVFYTLQKLEMPLQFINTSGGRYSYFLLQKMLEKNRNALRIIDLDNNILDDYNFHWGRWNNNLKDFYIESYRLVRDLNRESYLKIAGIRDDLSLRKIKKYIQKNN